MNQNKNFENIQRMYDAIFDEFETKIAEEAKDLVDNNGSDFYAFREGYLERFTNYLKDEVIPGVIKVYEEVFKEFAGDDYDELYDDLVDEMYRWSEDVVERELKKAASHKNTLFFKESAIDTLRDMVIDRFKEDLNDDEYYQFDKEDIRNCGMFEYYMSDVMPGKVEELVERTLSKYYNGIYVRGDYGRVVDVSIDNTEELKEILQECVLDDWKWESWIYEYIDNNL